MKFVYDAVSDILTIQFREDVVSRHESLTDDCIGSYTPDGVLVGYDVLNASDHFTASNVLKLMITSAPTHVHNNQLEQV